MDTILKVAGVLFLLGVGGCSLLAFTGAVVGGKAVHDVQQQIQSQPAASITLSQFNQLQPGMTYDQVVSILNAPGEVMSENTIGDGQWRVHTVMYQWQVGLGANMNAMFQNGQMVSKAQFGLR